MARGLAKEDHKILEALRMRLAHYLMKQLILASFSLYSLTFSYTNPRRIRRRGEIGIRRHIMNNYGYHLDDIADYSGARTAYEARHQNLGANLGAEHPQVATGVNTWAW